MQETRAFNQMHPRSEFLDELKRVGDLFQNSKGRINMLKRIALIVAVLVIAVGGVVIFGWATLTQTGNLSDPNKPVEVTMGKTFELKLESNPKSGYRWDLAKPLDEKVLNLLMFAYDAPGPLTGANTPGKEEWEFKAVAPGQAEIALKYVRPGTNEVAKTVTFNVVVK